MVLLTNNDLRLLSVDEGSAGLYRYSVTNTALNTTVVSEATMLLSVYQVSISQLHIQKYPNTSTVLIVYLTISFG